MLIRTLNIKRILYFLVGVYSLFQGYATGEILFYFFGALLIAQATFNVMCLMGGSCSVPRHNHSPNQ
jgi:hypothetical protein